MERHKSTTETVDVLDRLSPTSLNLRMRHFKFIQESNLNLGEFVRQKLDEEIEKKEKQE